MSKKSSVGKPSQNDTKGVVAKTSDGTIQITYSIPFEEIKKKRDEVVAEYAKNTQIAGFRKGKAPLSKVLERIPSDKLAEEALGKILPRLLAETITKDKLSFAIYPKFELIKAVENEDWEVRAITCGLPEITLGDYKKEFLGKLRKNSLWTPEKGKEEDKKEPTHNEREQLAIESLLETTKIDIPALLIQEEANARIARLLERIEKLGLTLEGYLASINKKIEDLRADYANQAKEALSVDFSLIEIAKKENIKVEEKEIDETIKMSAADPRLAESLNTPEQRSAIRNVLTKRAALETIVHAA